MQKNQKIEDLADSDAGQIVGAHLAGAYVAKIAILLAV
jgi:hypothetical protein